MFFKFQEKEDDKFRASCGAFIVNKNRGAVLSFERKENRGSRQLPQGGVKIGEDPNEGVYRELYEETGIKKDDLNFLGSYPAWLIYELPEEFQSKKHGRGQAQKFFYFEFSGDENNINLKDVKDNEFSNFYWSDFKIFLDRTVFFRKKNYTKLVDYFLENFQK